MIIDFHSHILPGVDHGSYCLDDSRDQLELISRGRVDSVVATSHFYPNMHTIEGFVNAVDAAAAQIAELCESYGSTKIYLGAEVLLCENLDAMDKLEQLCIRGTNCILIEMPMAGEWSAALIETVKNMIGKGYNVILAHVDRYLKIYGAEIDRMLAMGALAQINTDSLVSFFSRKTVMPYIESGFVCALGSDLHGPDIRASKMFLDAKKHIGIKHYSAIMSMSEELLKGAIPIN